MTSIVGHEMRRLFRARACTVTIGDTPTLERLQVHLVEPQLGVLCTGDLPAEHMNQ